MIYNFDELEFRPISVGNFMHKEGFFDVKARPFAAFSFRESGTGEFEIGGKRVLTNPGDVLFLPADTPYKVKYSVSKSIVVHFGYCNYFEAENISLNHPSRIEGRFRHLLESWNDRHSINHARSIIYDILEAMETDQKLSIDDQAIADCVRYIDANFRDPQINMEAVCASAFISVSSLQRAFAKYFGMSPKQYLIQLRMNQAWELLTVGALSIKEISYTCGFKDEKYFSRAFKKKYGFPPSQLGKHMSV